MERMKNEKPVKQPIAGNAKFKAFRRKIIVSELSKQTEVVISLYEKQELFLFSIVKSCT